MISFLRKLFGMHDHKWVTRFRGRYTRGVQCIVCGKADLRVETNDGSEPEGWLSDSH